VNSDNPAFWQECDALISSSSIIVDRPGGTPHPRRPELIYPLDYGYLKGTTAGDGAGIDVWLGGGCGRTVTAIACTIDLFKRDAEIKLLLGCSEEEIMTVSRFLNVTASLPCIILRRGAMPDE
jgi:inorganic pyrophosphatase